MKNNLVKRLTSILVIVALLFSGVISAGAAWDGYKENNTNGTKVLVDISNISKIFEAGAAPSNKFAHNGRYSAHWNNHPKNTYLHFSKIERDWSNCNKISFDIYSAKAVNAKASIVIYADHVPTPGTTSSYFKYDFNFNFQGWKTFSIDPGKFSAYNLADWSKINGVRFTATGWDLTPNPQTDVYISSIIGTLGERKNEIPKADKVMIIEDKTRSEIHKDLGKSTAVMNFADNAIVNGKVVPVSREDKVTTSGGESIATLAFYEKILGCKVENEGSTVTVTYDGKTENVTELIQEYDSVKYLPINKVMEKLGKESETYKQVTFIGDKESADKAKEDEAKFISLQAMLCKNDLENKRITKANWQEAKDNWRKFLVGDENNNIENNEIKAQLARINSDCKSAWEKLNKDTQILALFGDAPVTETVQMTYQYNYLYDLTRAYGTYGSEYYKNPQLLEDIMFALEWLYENLYGQDEIDGTGWKSTADWNWWDWYCGVPMPLCDSLMILEDVLSPVQIRKYLSLYDHLRKTMRTALTADYAASRVYTGTATALLEEDIEHMQKLTVDYNLMLAPVTSGNGIQEDDLYFTHDYYAYSSSYGTQTLLDRLSKVQSILSDTTFEFATPYKYNSCHYIYETFAPIMFNGLMTSTLMGRDKGREAYQNAYAVAAAVDFVGAFGKDDDIKLKQIIKRNVTETNMASIRSYLQLNQMLKLQEILNDTSIDEEAYYKNKIYYTGDSVVHQRDDFGFALSMSSTRVAGWESINGQNLTGWYQGDGMLLTYVDTDSIGYDVDYWTFANPHIVPGTTVDTQERTPASIKDCSLLLSNQDFVGAAGIENLYSVAAMQLKTHNSLIENPNVTTTGAGGDAPYHKSSLMAKKAWFMFDDELVALGSDINADDGFEVRTVLENKRLTKTEIMTASEEIDGESEYTVVSATATADDGNVPENTVDGDYQTRWSAQGDESLVLELAEEVPVGYVGIAQYGGTDGKQAIFELETSVDGENWTKVWEGKASGTTANMEPYDMQGTVAKFIKYNGHGRTNSSWNSVTEIKVYAPTEDGSMPVDGTVSENKIYGTEEILVDGVLLEKASTYEKSFVNPRWINIENFGGFYLPDGGELSINKVLNNAMSFAELWLSHGASPKDGTYSYVMLPKKTAAETDYYAENPDVEILSNTQSLQAVRENNLNLTGIVFWEAGIFEEITATAPMIIMTQEQEEVYEVNISDPTKLLTEASVTVSGNWELVSADSRCTVNSDGNNTVITIDFGGANGRTLPVTLKAK